MPAAGGANAPDSKKAVSGSYDNSLKLWDLETGKLLIEMVSRRDAQTRRV